MNYSGIHHVVKKENPDGTTETTTITFQIDRTDLKPFDTYADDLDIVAKLYHKNDPTGIAASDAPVEDSHNNLEAPTATENATADSTSN